MAINVSVPTSGILYLDIETTDMELRVRTYQLKNYTRYFNHKDITRDWSMLSFAYMYEGGQPRCFSVSPKDPLNDEAVVHEMHRVCTDAHTIIGHNSDNFDMKKFNARAITYGLTPLAPKVQIDTLKIARKYFKFTSNSLSYIAKLLGVSEKDESPDWEACINGCPKALAKMRQYNRQDVLVTRDVYKKLMSYHHTHPKNVESPRDPDADEVFVCNKCQSPNIKKNGSRRLASGRKRQLYGCPDCGGWQSGGLL